MEWREGKARFAMSDISHDNSPKIIPTPDFEAPYRDLLTRHVSIVDEDDGSAEDFPLVDFPQQYVFDLFEELGEDADELVLYLDEAQFHPGFCPDRLLDLRGELVVNGDTVERIHVGQVEYPFADWSSGRHGDGRDYEGVSGVFHWCHDNCKGVWIMTTEQHIKSWDYPHDVYVTFLDPADRAAFAAAWGKGA